MWFFERKRKIADTHLLAGATDHHSHILPGVDDGVQSIQEALHTLERYETTGIKELWLTPHVMEDFPNKATQLQECFAQLRATYNGSITLHLAAEYMIDNHFDTVLQNGTLQPIGNGGNHLLVETSYFTPPMRFKDTLQRIKSKGYHPLLAHPERYMYMTNADYRELRETGVKFQLNMLSLAGVYGSAAQKKGHWLLKNGLYNVAGSDMHHTDALDIINATPLDKKGREILHELLHNSL